MKSGLNKKQGLSNRAGPQKLSGQRITAKKLSKEGDKISQEIHTMSNIGTYTDNLDRSEWNASRSFKQMMSNLEEAFNHD